MPHTPAARGIQTGTCIQQAALTDLLSAALPSGMLQQGMQFSGVQEEVDGVKLSFQVRYRATPAHSFAPALMLRVELYAKQSTGHNSSRGILEGFCNQSMRRWLASQAAEAVQAKLVVVCGDAAASVARTVGPGQPWGRGRIAVIPKAADGQVAFSHC